MVCPDWVGVDDATCQTLEHVTRDLYQFSLGTEEELCLEGGHLTMAGKQVE